LIRNESQLLWTMKMPCEWEDRGNEKTEAIAQYKEMTVIPVNKVVDKKWIIKKGSSGGV
jgi:hypothetical protein